MRRFSFGVAAATALLLGCSSDPSSSHDGGSATETPSTSTTAASPGAPVQLGRFDARRIEVPGGSPDGLAFDGEAVYVKRDTGDVDVVDPSDGAIVGSIEIGAGLCSGIGVGLGSVWTCRDGDVVRLDVAAESVVDTIAAGKAASQTELATGFGRVWVLRGDGSSVVTIDAATDAVSEPIALPVRGTDLAVDADGVWIASALDDAVFEVDPDSGAVRHRIDGVPGAVVVAVADDGAVWVGAATAVHRIDPTTGTIDLTVDGGVGSTGAVAPDGDGGLWVRRGEAVTHVDATGVVVAADGFELGLGGPSPGDLLVAGEALWLTASEHAALFRVDVRRGD
jgi:hypothetical protein